jgi:hypothetical protein
MFEEYARRVILVVVWVVLLLRTPSMVLDRHQRPLWMVLAVIAAGSIVIQSWFGAAINAATGITQFNNLFQGVWGVLDVAVTLEFLAHMAEARWRAARIWAAVGTIVAMSVLFALTPPAERFVPPASPSAFTAYALVAATYMIAAAGLATWVTLCHLPHVRGGTLYLGLLMVTVGNSTEIPFMVIRTVQRLSAQVTPDLLKVALLLNTARFVLVPLGCTIAAIEPIRHTVLYCVRRARVYSLWYLLRSSTTTLTLAPLVSRHRDVLVVDNAWERLHRRVIEIRDSIFHLHDTRAWPELLREAEKHAQSEPNPAQRRLITIASWLEVTRRAAVSQAPKQHRDVDKALLPELLADESTLHIEVRYLLRLHRAMRSRSVRTFADTVGSLPQ